MSIQRIRILVLLFWIGLAGWFLFSPDPDFSSKPSDVGGEPGLFWFKGNTHSHARIQVGSYVHGDSTPAEVADWYKQHGYHFVSITDHNRYEDAQNLKFDADEGFLLIPGMEVTSDYLYPGVNQQGERRIHATALNVNNELDWNFEDSDKPSIIRLQSERTRQYAGLHILNHPNYRFQIELDDVLASNSVSHMEIYNTHPRSNHSGHAAFRPGVEELWDQILSEGQRVYGVAADDAHDFKWYRQWLRRFGAAPPGGAWIMVKADELSPEKITSAIGDGQFYASTGVHLQSVLAGADTYSVTIDRVKTLEETAHDWVRKAAPVVPSDDSHYVIEFISQHGQVLHATHDQDSAAINLYSARASGYVRAKVTYLDKIPSLTGADRARAYYAWTQPVMTGSGQSDQ